LHEKLYGTNLKRKSMKVIYHELQLNATN